MATATRRWEGLAPAGGAVLAVAIALVLFLQFSLDDILKRDEAIYAYGGQQLVEGVAPYASIFDPKTPLATGFTALGVVAARAAGAADGGGDVHGMRVLFFAFAILAVLAVYALGLWLWGSALAALGGAVVFCSFRGFALDAIGGPNAKTPGVFLSVLAMALLVRRRWFWGALAGALAFLVWQPLGVYAAAALVAAPLTAEPGRRLAAFARAVAGAAIPVVVCVLAFLVAGALPKLVEAAFRFPLTGIIRPPQTLLDRLRTIHRVITDGYGETRWLLYGGVAFLLVLIAVRLVRGRRDPRAAAADPLVVVLGLTFVPLAVFSATDFQGYPDVYPALPYAAIGVGGIVAAVMARVARPAPRRAAAAAWLAGIAVLTAIAWSWYADTSGPPRGGLAVQRQNAAQVLRALGPREPFYALGNPAPLVLTRRRNPSRFVYLSSGVAQWEIRHTPGRLPGWERRLLALRPAMVMVSNWHGPCQLKISNWLGKHFEPAYVGNWAVFVPRAVRARAQRRGVHLPLRPAPTKPGGSCAG